MLFVLLKTRDHCVVLSTRTVAHLWGSYLDLKWDSCLLVDHLDASCLPTTLGNEPSTLHIFGSTRICHRCVMEKLSKTLLCWKNKTKQWTVDEVFDFSDEIWTNVCELPQTFCHVAPYFCSSPGDCCQSDDRSERLDFFILTDQTSFVRHCAESWVEGLRWGGGGVVVFRCTCLFEVNFGKRSRDSSTAQAERYERFASRLNYLVLQSPRLATRQKWIPSPLWGEQ